MGFFSDLLTMGPSFALDGLKLDIDNAIDDVRENPGKAAVTAVTAVVTVATVASALGKTGGTGNIRMFTGSPECEEWIEETGGRDEDCSEYYNKWLRRTQTS